MDGKGNISDYRRKLDKTLASHDLTDDEILQTLVKNQILQSSHLQLEGYIENVVERRSKELSNLLSMLRSASVDDIERSKSSEEPNTGWKIKQDTEEIRVMYREGPRGTPFHTLLAEGYVDGPLDVCMCISCESRLYKKWWPQIAVPTFRVISSKCLQRVRDGEQISLVRKDEGYMAAVKQRGSGALFCIPDSETIERHTHGFTRDGIPDAEDVVRIDVVGGFALQKVTADRSYFRTIANMDIKLDFVPPALINFISRQLIGSGFRLYKKAVASVSKGDEEYREALKDPLYTRIREALYSGNSTKSQEDNLCDDSITDSVNAKDVMFIDRNEVHEIKEFEENYTEGHEPLDYSTDQITEKFEAEKEEHFISIDGEEDLRTNGITENYGSEIRKKAPMSPKVERALETLEKVIFILREHNSNSGKNLTDSEKEDVGKLMSLEDDRIMSRKDGNFAESSKLEAQQSNALEPRISSDSHASRRKSSNSYTRETNQISKIVPASPDENRSSPSNTNKPIATHSLIMNQKNDSTVFEINVTEDYPPDSGNRATKRKNKKSAFCCLHFRA
ncbi:hypothetical protein DH2020_039759 [Rehmannia glutinosa]|uniref:START domain-containing protein n=1 Tax=Rehmannia glutinosa TaxID=99300 RepID=A0ABR0UVF5_REHGL